MPYVSAMREFLHQREKPTPVVVYDSLEGTYFCGNPAEYEGDGKYAQYGRFVDIPTTNDTRSTVVDLKVETPEGAHASLAMLDLGKLGHRVKTQRKRGNLNKVFVLDHKPIPPPEPGDSLANPQIEGEN